MSISGVKKRRFIMFCVLGIVIAFTIILVSFLFFSPSEISTSSNLVVTKRVDGQAGGGGSEEYNKKVKTDDAQKADKALVQGDSFVPTPIGAPSVIMKEQPVVKTPIVTPVVVAPVRQKEKPSSKFDNEMLKRMMADLKMLDGTLVSSMDTGKIVYIKDFEQENNKNTTKKVNLEEKGEDKTLLKIKPGTLLYAIVDTGVNSDVPSAVMATVVVGEYKGVKLLGKFQRFEKRLVLAFSRGILKSGEDVQLEGYAIDPETTEASVASAVNTHFFSRWGGLIASSFLAGLGEAKQYSGATSNYDNFGGNTNQMVFSDYSIEDQLWIAAGKVGEKSSEIFAKNFDRPPTVYLDSGSSIGVLILNVK